LGPGLNSQGACSKYAGLIEYAFCEMDRASSTMTPNASSQLRKNLRLPSSSCNAALRLENESPI